MKKILSLVILLAMVVLGSPAYAQFDRERADNAGYVNAIGRGSDQVLVARPAYVYAVTIDATSASASVDLYDSASTTTNTGLIKAEVGQATQHNSTRVVYDPPLYFQSGVYADVTSGGVVVEYR